MRARWAGGIEPHASAGLARRPSRSDCSPAAPSGSRDCGIGRRGGTINVFAEVGRKIAPAGVHRRVTIADNVIRDADGSAIHVNSADGAAVTGNTIERPSGEAIFVDHSRNVRIEGNKLIGGAVGLKIGPNCDRATIRAAGNTGF